MKADIMTPQVGGGGINAKTIDIASINLERSASPKKRMPRHSQIQIEDFSEIDAQSLFEVVRPYLKDLYNDLIVRCIEPEAI